MVLSDSDQLDATVPGRSKVVESKRGAGIRVSPFGGPTFVHRGVDLEVGAEVPGAAIGDAGGPGRHDARTVTRVAA